MPKILDPIQAWEAHCKTLLLDPVPDNDPLPKKGRRLICITDETEGTHLELCPKTATVCKVEPISYPEKVAA